MGGQGHIPFQTLEDEATPAAGGLRWIRLAASAALVVFALAGWALAVYAYFIELPTARVSSKVSTALELTNRFYESPAQAAYVRLSDGLKPWWTQIEDTQVKIRATTNDDERIRLIAARDQSLIDFIEKNKLAGDIDMMVAAFEPISRCVATDSCDTDVLRGIIGVDVRRLYRTFKPWIQTRREQSRDYGRPLEELFFQFSR